MKYFIVLLLLFIGGVAVFLNRQIILQKVHPLFYYSPCNTPITYRLGDVDPRFGMNNNDLLKDTQQAAAVWNSAASKTLITYNPQSKLSVNLVYDQRQALDTQINQLEGQLKNEKQNLTPQMEEYKKLGDDFQQKLNQLNSEITFWNRKGGAPPDVYNDLTKRQEDLQQETNKLNEMAKSLNQQSDAFNLNVAELNHKVNSFNNALQTKPEEGLYNGNDNTISIYFDVNNDELHHTLTHEFGHALGLGHNADPQAIMYPYTTTSLSPTNADLAEIQALCLERSFIEIWRDQINLIVQQIQHAKQ